jgi:spermidine synthase
LHSATEHTTLEKRIVLDRSTTPDGERLELAIEHGHHIIRVAGIPLMSSDMRGSEEAMAEVAREELGDIEAPRVLVGGLGLGYTLRAALDAWGEDAEVCVAELLPSVVRYNREFLGNLADHPLEDPRVDLFEGDVKKKLVRDRWDAILLDVDNGPDAFTVHGNQTLYGARGAELMARAIGPGGVLIVWSAYPSPRFLERLRHTGLSARAKRVRGRGPIDRGPMHTLFVATKP